MPDTGRKEYKMKKYRVVMECNISHVVDVEAETEEDALNEANRQGLGQVMFLNHDYPDMGEWEALGVFENPR